MSDNFTPLSDEEVRELLGNYGDVGGEMIYAPAGNEIAHLYRALRTIQRERERMECGHRRVDCSAVTRGYCLACQREQAERAAVVDLCCKAACKVLDEFRNATPHRLFQLDHADFNEGIRALVPTDRSALEAYKTVNSAALRTQWNAICDAVGVPLDSSIREIRSALGKVKRDVELATRIEFQTNIKSWELILRDNGERIAALERGEGDSND